MGLEAWLTTTVSGGGGVGSRLREREEARRAAQEQRRREREHESREEETAGNFSREFADAVHGNQLPLLHPSLETSGPLSFSPPHLIDRKEEGLSPG